MVHKIEIDYADLLPHQYEHLDWYKEIKMLIKVDIVLII